MIEFSTQEPFEAESKKTHAAVEATRTWLEKAVIGLNLCPFAKAVHVKRQIRYAVSDARDADSLAKDLARELALLIQSDPATLDTTLLIHPHALNDFLDYNDFLDIADEIINSTDLNGILQIASFHPHYQFEGSNADDIENYTNRSPFPILHLLREASVERAVDSFPDAADIYEKNIATLKQLGHEGLKDLGIAMEASYRGKNQ